jgi:hypothetical protein
VALAGLMTSACGDPDVFWSSTSTELRLRVRTIIAEPPSSTSGCTRFARASMTAAQLQVLSNARLTFARDRCTTDGCIETRAEVFDEDGTSFAAPVHGFACACDAARRGMPSSIQTLFGADQGSVCE